LTGSSRPTSECFLSSDLSKDRQQTTLGEEAKRVCLKRGLSTLARGELAFQLPSGTWPLTGQSSVRRDGLRGVSVETTLLPMSEAAPETFDDLIAHRQANHSTVAIQELMHTIGHWVGCMGGPWVSLPRLANGSRSCHSSDPRAGYREARTGGAVAGNPLPPPESFGASKGTGGAAKYGRSRTVHHSCGRRSSALWCSPRISATTLSWSN